ncbi:DUF5134 domain-containing protein [Streptomyces sp. BPTC-684]|uniref:DUF5134 domain-containing protein n=1 Tax=Streptomyces sp. BPTC-684 TaxID=3043734 RepID=UPI0024B230E1|nr:DUF5134 domain-containing protein [Streptomyces sp. BPTC-684]WHM39968.1 DUF5134 domain-containing protein [Streptomyces sp. BPTC-684]
MHGTALSGWLLVAVCAATGAYCVIRLRSDCARARSSAGGEAVMGFGMAAMAVPAAFATPPSWIFAAYAGVFGAVALRAGWLARARGNGGGHHLHHVIGSLAMVYMALAMSAPGGHAHGEHTGPAGGIPLVTGVLLVYYVGYVLTTGARLLPVAGPVGDGGARGWGARPELTLACRLSMGIAMLAMLLAL